MSSVFQLLGMIFDDISEEVNFLYEWVDGALLIECNNCHIVDDFILPLCEGKIDDCEWFFAVIKIAKNPQYQISEITFTTNLGSSITCNVGLNILDELANPKGLDDSYLKFCEEIAKKCSFFVDK